MLFKDSIIKSINSDEFDTKEFYEQARFFIQAILDNKLIIKKTREPNHAKLYIFNMKDEHLDLKPCCFITGSSCVRRDPGDMTLHAGGWRELQPVMSMRAGRWISRAMSYTMGEESGS